MVLGPVELEDRLTRTGLLPGEELGEGTHAQQAHDLDLDVALRQPLTDGGVVAAAPVLGQLEQTVELAAEHHRHGGGGLAALVAEEGHGDGPAVVHTADDVLLAGTGIGEERLVELGLARDHLDRSQLDAGLVGGAQDEADALVLGRVEVGAAQDEDPVGVGGRPRSRSSGR